MQDCIFCKVSRGEIESRLVWEDEDLLAFRDINPQAPTHILIIPRKHVASLSEVSPAAAETLGRMLLAGRDLAAREGLKDGFRLVINNGVQAGQSVSHLHLHLLGGRSLGWPPG